MRFRFSVLSAAVSLFAAGLAVRRSSFHAALRRRRFAPTSVPAVHQNTERPALTTAIAKRTQRISQAVRSRTNTYQRFRLAVSLQGRERRRSMSPPERRSLGRGQKATPADPVSNRQQHEGVHRRSGVAARSTR